ncbi:MAG: S41 family peptidase [Candidatus Kapabacteria bacterium]|nr:S41 family peptidase [Candidatus Kapabacteria bacterium]
MKRIVLFVSILAVSLLSFGFYAGSESVYFRINRSLELFSSVFREISENYVDDIEPEQFIRSGIDGMLETLDPYTELFDQARSEDFDALTTGQYTGFGISVAIRDSMLTITGLTDGYSAQTNGIRIGDRLYSIDSTMTLRFTSRDLKKYTRGEPGSKAVVRILRDGLKDTLVFNLTRERISVKSVTYIGKTANNIGVIKLERFSRKSADEIRRALDSLRSTGQLNGIILDLRDNPGGLLDAAISICECFVPTGSKIVSTKARGASENKTYVSNTVPYEASLPLAVLINKYSASASEIVAGCIQDLDRGVVIGEPSFGKGLVQSVYPMPYNNSLKITTAKYYTPSGRCIQKIDYTKKRNGVATVSTQQQFLTLNKRIVKEGNAITPDSTIVDDTNAGFISQLSQREVLFRFANEYASSRTSLPEKFSAASLLDDVERFAQKKKFAYENPAQKSLSEVRKILNDEKFSADVVKHLDETEKAIAAEQKKLFATHGKEIVKILDEEIRSRFTTDQIQTEYAMQNDGVIRNTADLLMQSSYRALLRTPVVLNQPGK